MVSTHVLRLHFLCAQHRIQDFDETQRACQAETHARFDRLQAMLENIAAAMLTRTTDVPSLSGEGAHASEQQVPGARAKVTKVTIVQKASEQGKGAQGWRKAGGQDGQETEPQDPDLEGKDIKSAMKASYEHARGRRREQGDSQSSMVSDAECARSPSPFRTCFDSPRLTEEMECLTSARSAPSLRHVERCNKGRARERLKPKLERAQIMREMVSAGSATTQSNGQDAGGVEKAGLRTPRLQQNPVVSPPLR